MKRIIVFFLIFVVGFLFSQQVSEENSFLKKAIQNHHSFFKNPLTAFKNAQTIEKTAYHSGAEEAELTAINTQCLYYLRKNDFDDVKTKATLLFDKAEQYHNLPYQTNAKTWLSEFYRFNQLYDRAFSELEKGTEIISKADGSDSLVINAKSNLYSSYCNFYAVKNDWENQLKYIRLSMEEHQKNSDQQYRQELQFLDFSNLAAVYYKINADSATYYAQRSMSKDFGYNRQDIRFNNLMILGLVKFDKKDFPQALQYFQNAEKEAGFNNNIDIQELYDKITETYAALHDSINQKKYAIKRDSLKLTMTQVQNKSLHSLLNEKPEENAADNTQYFLYFGIVFGAIIVVLFLIFRKKKEHQNPETDIIVENPPSSAQDYSTLVEMLKKNDPAFMSYFGKLFPEFNSTLLKINPKLIASDLEYCALLKLNIPTHNIAQYKNITTKSVQNKKYHIRKKLNIPTDVDTYVWFSDL